MPVSEALDDDDDDKCMDFQYLFSLSFSGPNVFYLSVGFFDVHI